MFKMIFKKSLINTQIVKIRLHNQGKPIGAKV